jgi:hypothetical protein
MEITRELVDRQRRPRFGSANPERMSLELWQWIIEQDLFPSQLRERFQLPYDRDEGPIWCFQRDGQTRTELEDGRVLHVGGEYEDWYDIDFCIYNDVIVFDPSGGAQVFGYPGDVFPPTDFHTATLVGNGLILVGGLGYPEDRRPGTTPVYHLDPATYRIERVPTEGDAPGWLFHHEAEFDPGRHAVLVRGGQVIEGRGGEEWTIQNVEEYALRLDDWRWQRLTDRGGWRQFAIRRRDGEWFDALNPLGDEVFHIEEVPHEPLEGTDSWARRIVVSGVPVSFSEDIAEVRILIEGRLSDQVVLRLVEDLLSNVEAASGHPCSLVEL